MPTILFYAGSCGLIITFVEDITNDLEFLNVIKASNQNWSKKRADFCNIIQLHMKVKRLSEQIKDFNFYGILLLTHHTNT